MLLVLQADIYSKKTNRNSQTHKVILCAMFVLLLVIVHTVGQLITKFNMTLNKLSLI